jgi:hypothetical protein
MQSRCDIPGSIHKLPHNASTLLARICLNGAPVVLASEPWDQSLLHKRFQRGPHKYVDEYVELLAGRTMRTNKPVDGQTG